MYYNIQHIFFFNNNIQHFNISRRPGLISYGQTKGSCVEFVLALLLVINVYTTYFNHKHPIRDQTDFMWTSQVHPAYCRELTLQVSGYDQIILCSRLYLLVLQSTTSSRFMCSLGHMSSTSKTSYENYYRFPYKYSDYSSLIVSDNSRLLT